jgi:hypothetical protein
MARVTESAEKVGVNWTTLVHLVFRLNNGVEGRTDEFCKVVVTPRESVDILLPTFRLSSTSMTQVILGFNEQVVHGLSSDDWFILEDTSSNTVFKLVEEIFDVARRAVV